MWLVHLSSSSSRTSWSPSPGRSVPGRRAKDPSGTPHAIPSDAQERTSAGEMSLRAGGVNTSKTEGRFVMIYYALVFLIVGLVAGALGLYGIAAIAGQISWILFLIALVFLVIHVVSGRRMPMS